MSQAVGPWDSGGDEVGSRVRRSLSRRGGGFSGTGMGTSPPLGGMGELVTPLRSCREKRSLRLVTRLMERQARDVGSDVASTSGLRCCRGKSSEAISRLYLSQSQGWSVGRETVRSGPCFPLTLVCVSEGDEGPNRRMQRGGPREACPGCWGHSRGGPPATAAQALAWGRVEGQCCVCVCGCPPPLPGWAQAWGAHHPAWGAFCSVK